MEQRQWEEWGRRIVAARMDIGMKQVQLANTVHRTTTTVRRWERGQNPPTDDMKVQLCRLLHRDWAELFPVPIVAGARPPAA